MSLARRAFVAGALLASTGIAFADEPTLRIAVGIGPTASPFWAARDAEGVPHGMTVDLGRAFAARLNRNAALVAYDNSGAITEAAARGEWDVTFVPVDDARRQRLDFGPAYDDAEATYIVRAGLPIATIGEIDRADLVIAAITGTATGRAAQASLKNVKIKDFATVDEVLSLLRAGKVDAFALPRGILEALATTLPGAHILPGSYARTIAAIAVPKGRPEMLAAAVAFMQDAERSGLLRKIRDQNKLP